MFGIMPGIAIMMYIGIIPGIAIMMYIGSSVCICIIGCMPWSCGFASSCASATWLACNHEYLHHDGHFITVYMLCMIVICIMMGMAIMLSISSMVDICSMLCMCIITVIRSMMFIRSMMCMVGMMGIGCIICIAS